MDTNKNKLIHPELSYLITGILFGVHNEMGRFAREKQYSNLLEKKIEEIKIPYNREISINNSGDIVDFIIDNKIIIELKAKRMIVREDYYQIQRYLQSSGIQLGILVNFGSQYLKPIRIIRIDKIKSTYIN